MALGRRGGHNKLCRFEGRGNDLQPRENLSGPRNRANEELVPYIWYK